MATATPVATATPEVTSTPKATPSPILPVDVSELPKPSFDSMKEAIEAAIEANENLYLYEQKTTYSSPDFRENVLRTNRNDVLEYFSNAKERKLSGGFSEEVSYLKGGSEPGKQIYTLSDGKKVTLYTTAYGYALDYPGAKREYLYTLDQDIAGRTSYYADYSGTSYTCCSYNAGGKLQYRAIYDKQTDDLLGYYLYDYEYDEHSRLTRLVSAHYNASSGRFTYVYTDSFAYDDSDNLISHACTAKNPSESFEEHYSFKKDSDGRITGWTESGTDEQEYFVHYFSDGKIFVYTEYNTEEQTLFGYVYTVSEELLGNLRSGSHLRIDRGRIAYDPEDGILPGTYYYELLDYDEASFNGLPYRREEESRAAYETVFAGELGKSILSADTWNITPEYFEGKPNWYTRIIRRNKDGNLDNVYLQEGNTYSIVYRYDENGRLVHESYFNFDVTKEISYTYDKDGNLISRERIFQQGDTGFGELDTTTTYRYEYDKITGRLSSMTEETVSNNKPSASRKSTLKAVPTSGRSANQLMSLAYNSFAAENSYLLAEHEKNCLTELRALFKDIPVHKLNLLSTLVLNEHDTVEIYESAHYGKAPAYQKTDTDNGIDNEFSGVDPAAELYSYDIVCRFLTDGRCIGSATQTEDSFNFNGDCIFSDISWTSEYADDAEAVCKMVGLTYQKSDIAFTSVSVWRPIQDTDCSVILSAFYLDNASAPAFVRDYISYNGNDGGIFDDHLRAVTDDKFDLAAVLGKAVMYNREKEGTGRLNGKDVTWEITKTSSGATLVEVTTPDPEGMTGVIDRYLYVNNCLILLGRVWYC
ncbi:MAG: hypothetical protein J5645_00870 [Lachnospiraceae bacterium]|nr:hypothetical protein [Lachnospiraceae bacterium]